MDPRSFVSRAGLKLEHALNEFSIDVAGFVCADFGCNVGGFTDCLLQHGAARVYAIDTAYGTLDYTLRTDDRVVVLERTNALHAEPAEAGEGFAGCDLVTIDLGWTPQRHALPAALKWLKPSPAGASLSGGRIISLIKPHYELDDAEKRAHLVDGALPPEVAATVLQRVLDSLPGLGLEHLAHTESPIRGGKSQRKSPTGGNVEYLLLARAM